MGQKQKAVNQTKGKLYHFMDYKMKKPFFHKPMKIMLDSPAKETYFLMKNVVYKEKQILALRHEQDPDTIVLVEGKIKDGQLINLLMLPEEYVGEVSRLLADTI